MYKTTRITSLCLMLMFSITSISQVSISEKDGQQAHPSAILDLISEEKGVLIPRLTQEQINAIVDPADHLMVINLDSDCVEMMINGFWFQLWCYESPCSGYEGSTYEYEKVVDGYTYRLVDIGNQCWFAENIRYNYDNCYNETWVNYQDRGWCGYYYDGSDELEEYGKLYQWSAALNVCPAGWTLPSNNDWTMLERAICVSGTCIEEFPLDNTTISWRGTDEGDRIKCNEYDDGAFCNEEEFCGTSSFTALPGGFRRDYGTYSQNNAFWWTSTQDGGDAWRRVISPNRSDIDRATRTKANAYSVRCVRE